MAVTITTQAAGKTSVSMTLPAVTDMLFAMTCSSTTVPTWNGTAMTLVYTESHNTNVRLYKLQNPAIGTYTLAFGTNDFFAAIATSGGDNANFPDAIAEKDDYPFTVNVSSLTPQLTTVHDNAKVMFFGYEDNGHALAVGTSGWTLLAGGNVYPGNFVGAFARDSALSPAGTTSCEFHTTSGNGHMYAIIFSLAPTPSTPTINPLMINQSVKRASFF